MKHPPRAQPKYCYLLSDSVTHETPWPKYVAVSLFRLPCTSNKVLCTVSENPHPSSMGVSVATPLLALIVQAIIWCWNSRSVSTFDDMVQWQKLREKTKTRHIMSASVNTAVNWEVEGGEPKTTPSGTGTTSFFPVYGWRCQLKCKALSSFICL